MATMRAVEFDRFGPADVLEVRQVPRPAPGPGEVLVRVAAASVNPKDTFVRKGRFARYSGKRFPLRSGYDFAGTVAEAGPGADLPPGTPVWGMLNGWAAGACADYLAAGRDEVAHLPTGLSMAEAASLPLAAQTALQALRDHGGVRPGHRVLVHGASGGVGSAAVQVAAALGARVTGTCSAANADLVRSLGAEEAVDYRERAAEQVPGPFDTVFDVFGNLGFGRVRRMLAPKGRYVTTVPSRRNILDMILTRLSWGRRASLVVVKSSRADLEFLGRLVETGRLRPLVDRVYPLDAVRDAHRHVETKHTRGKVVVSL